MSFVGGGSPDAAVAMGSPAGYVDPFQGVPVKDMGSAPMSIPEMNALREWEDKHERDLEEKSRKEETEKKDKRKNAESELQKFYQDSTSSFKKRQASNRKDETATEQARADAMKPGANPWERVVDLIDTNARTADESRDTSRMRALLIQLKSSPIAAA